MNHIKLFENKKIRSAWLEKEQQWYFAVVDVVSVLTNSSNPQVYWRVLKKRLIDEGSNETVTKCNGLKMVAADGKIRETDCANTETMFRIIQSIPSPKAEPLNRWLAKVGYERIQEIEDPELHVFGYGVLTLSQIKKRIKELKLICDKLSLNYQKKFYGKKLEVLIEGPCRSHPGFLEGYSGNYIKLIFCECDCWNNRSSQYFMPVEFNQKKRNDVGEQNKRKPLQIF